MSTYTMNMLRKLNPFRHPKGEAVAEKRTLREGIAGHWHYHYATEDGKEALCGANTMASNATEDDWGYRSHLHERYCKKCEELKRGV